MNESPGDYQRTVIVRLRSPGFSFAFDHLAKRNDNANCPVAEKRAEGFISIFMILEFLRFAARCFGECNYVNT